MLESSPIELKIFDRMGRFEISNISTMTSIVISLSKDVKDRSVKEIFVIGWTGLDYLQTLWKPFWMKY